MNIRFCDIFYANLDGTGSVQNGVRPVLIAQNNKGNKYAPTVTVIPITTKMKSSYMPTHVYIDNPETVGLNRHSVLLCEQIQTIRKDQLGDLIGTLPNEMCGKIADAMAIQCPFQMP